MATTAVSNEANQSDEKQQRIVEVTDSRTGTTYKVALTDDTIPASFFSQMGLSLYDNGYLNTSVCRSAVSYIDGDRGILRYRGYNIEDLAEHSSFVEVSYLLIYGDLPTKKQLDTWNTRIMRHTYVHENMIDYMKSFRYDAHPMGMLVSSIAAMSTFHPEASTALHGDQIYNDERMVNKQIFRLVGKIPTLAAIAYRHRIGRPYVYPNQDLDFTGNFLFMMDRLSEMSYTPNPALVRALDIIFILHADHELNCSTAAVRQLGSTGIDPYICVSASAAALYGPMHGGANEAALRMLEEIGTVDRIPAFIEEVKAKKRKLMGFGHRVYKRAKLMRKTAEEVFKIMGRNPIIDVAIELERIALSDEYFIKRNLYPNVDFYSGIIYKCMGFPTDFFPVLFAIARTTTPIFRPAQAYDGVSERTYVPMEERGESGAVLDGSSAKGNPRKI
ncbi:hypothetical protein HDU77_004394 [Chytriomyces hyalinus]|nr:hypothetical protein HDU77_004842 [Chytriomyces hyalinus]KAJ3253736.1 hypothetical protein HDU77_004394 [Chytriomyces hyalinus]